MTATQFERTQWGVGMKIKHIDTYMRDEPLVTIHDVVSVNFAEGLIGVDDEFPDQCEHCENSNDTLEWLRYENCEIING